MPRALFACNNCSDILQDFTFHVGLEVNQDNSALVLKGDWSEFDKAFLASHGWPINDWYKYLGVFWGDISPQEAYASTLAGAMSRAGRNDAQLEPFP